MVTAYLVVGTHLVRVHCDVNGRQCECPVLESGGVGLILAPLDWEIQRDFREHGTELLLELQRINPRIRSLRMSTES